MLTKGKEGSGKECEKLARKPKRHHYHKANDGDEALTTLVPSRHVDEAPDARHITALAHVRRTQGLGGN